MINGLEFTWSLGEEFGVIILYFNTLKTDFGNP